VESLAHCGCTKINDYAFLWMMPEPKTAKKTTHGGPRPRAGRPKANGRVLLTVRVEPDLRQRLEAKAAVEKCSLTELVERLLKSALQDVRG
jgi:hypothetical protein